MQDNEFDFKKGVVITGDIEKLIEESQKTSENLNAINTYKSPLEALMAGNKETEDTPNDGAPEYNIKMIENIVNKILKMSSVFKVDVFNLDNSDARAMYSKLQNKPNIKIISEDGSWCTYEVSNKDERSKDTYYKVVVKYREVDYDKFIDGFEKACRSAILTHEIAIPIMFKLFYELEARSEELIEKLSKAYEEGIKHLKEERIKRKEILEEKIKKLKEKKAKEEALNKDGQ